MNRIRNVVRKRRRLVSMIATGVLVICLVPRQAKAVFGFGDIVFDPSVFGQVVAEVTQSIATFKLLKDELRTISARSVWRTVAAKLPQMILDETNGETHEVVAALNGAAADVRVAWSGATLRLDDTGFFAGDAPGSTVHIADAASIEMADGFAADAIQTIGDYRSGQPTINQALDDLEAREQSTDEEDNTPVAQQNITNGALLVMAKLQQSNIGMNAVIAEQLAVANTWQRNVVAEGSNIFGGAVTSRATDNADLANVADTLTNYRIP